MSCLRGSPNFSTKKNSRHCRSPVLEGECSVPVTITVTSLLLRRSHLFRYYPVLTVSNRSLSYDLFAICIFFILSQSFGLRTVPSLFLYGISTSTTGLYFL